ncbi:unnamed protein product [Ilex paraguariensis]|uniref:WW domain-containing protein n=1 Tax=Ilex paraguariensis TaxID=185542 RepID=A0ABC8U8K7_9AQUA
MDSYLFLSLSQSAAAIASTSTSITFSVSSNDFTAEKNSSANQQQQLLQPQHQSPSQLAQMISQQKKTLQLPWPWIIPETVANTPAIPAVGDVPPVTSAALAVPIANRAVAPAKCNWTEHTSPDGYKYSYNSTTGESKWEKLEELTLYEQQQQKPSVQQPQTLSHPQGLFTANSSDTTNAAPNTTSDTASKPASTPSAVGPNFSIFIDSKGCGAPKYSGIWLYTITWIN